jgi:hypothetical protein
VPYFWPRDERLRLTAFSESHGLQVAVLGAFGFLIPPAWIRVFSEDEYQACSGIGRGADKKTVVVKRKDPTGAEANPLFCCICGPTKVVPCYKTLSVHPLGSGT